MTTSHPFRADVHLAQSESADTADASLELALSRPDLIKQARRIGKRLEGRAAPMLVVRVAIESDRETAQLGVSEKSALARLVQGLLDKTFALPARGTEFPQSSWAQVVFNTVLNQPSVAVANRLARDLERELRQEYGKLYYRIFQSVTSIYYRPQQDAMAVARRTSWDEYKERTPETLARFIRAVDEAMASCVAELKALSDRKLYDPKTDPQYVVDKLKNHNHDDIWAILRAVHNIRRPRHREKDVPNDWDVADSTVSVSALLEAYRKRDRAYEASAAAFARTRYEALERFVGFVDDLGTDHAPTVSRRLRESGLPYLVDTAQRARARNARIDLGDGGYVYGSDHTVASAILCARNELRECQE